MTTIAYEINFDGLVGMTHHYAGLALGNLPSMEHAGQESNPRQAALQGLNKMKLLASMGIRQGILPPHERPHIPSLKRLGFVGNVETIFERVQSEADWLIPYVSSSASMWTANSATVSPSVDSSDEHVHFTPANLASYFHRSIEAETNSRIFKAIFPNPVFFDHHTPLLAGNLFFDEGAANHTRFCKTYQGPGVQLFTYGQMLKPPEENEVVSKPKKFPARQSLEASEAIARLHQLYPGHFLFAQQNPDVVDSGVFHNDVISVGNQNVFLVHERSFVGQPSLYTNLKKMVSEICDTEMIILEVKESQISLKEAVSSYFFNSQLLTLPDNTMTLIAPLGCQKSESITRFLKDVTDSKQNPIGSVHYVDLTQSLENGGGPACLRLRVVLKEVEIAEMNQGVLFTDRLYTRLVEHINKYYPTRLTDKDLTDPAFYERNCESLNEITNILNLGKIYPFQMT